MVARATSWAVIFMLMLLLPAPRPLTAGVLLLMKRRRRAEGATGVFEQLNRSITWPSKPPIKKVMRASVYTYTRVESLAEEPQSSRVCMLMSTDLKGGLQSRMAGQMQRTMISRADDSAKAMIKELSKRAGGARHG